MATLVTATLLGSFPIIGATGIDAHADGSRPADFSRPKY